jgi:SAM-dependent methyltransferase
LLSDVFAGKKDESSQGKSSLPEAITATQEEPQSVALRRVLNVGGNSKAIPLPSEYHGFDHWLLDIDPKGSPDIVCDARELTTLEPGMFDAVYCSHNLEHYYRHDVPRVLAGFQHVLKEGGFAHIRVPDINEVMRLTIERGLDIDDVLYTSPSGPIMVLDVLYGYTVQIEQSGEDFYAHKTGFTQKSLLSALDRAGFSKIYSTLGNLEISVVAFKGRLDPSVLNLFDLPGD